MSLVRSAPLVPFSPDGSLTRVPGSIPAELQSPEFAILDPSIPETRARKPPRWRWIVAPAAVADARALLEEASSRDAA